MNFVVIAIIVLFILMVALMVANKIPTLVALPLMGIILALVGGVPVSYTHLCFCVAFRVAFF